MESNINRILEEITQGDVLTQGDVSELASKLNSLTQISMVSLVISLIIGATICFFGLKLVKLWSGLAGLFVGAVVGTVACILLGLAGISVLLIILFASLLMMVLCVMFRRFGMFWVCLFAGISVGSVVLYINPLAGMVVSLGGGVIAAIVGAIAKDPIVIIMTSLQGGIIAGTAVFKLISMENVWIGIVASIVISIIGMVIQFMTKSREIGKSEKVRAKKVKQEKSMEAEVEAARNLIDDEEENIEE